MDWLFREHIKAAGDFLRNQRGEEFRSAKSRQEVNEYLARLGSEAMLAVYRIPRAAACAGNAVAYDGQPRAEVPQQRRVRLRNLPFLPDPILWRSVLLMTRCHIPHALHHFLLHHGLRTVVLFVISRRIEQCRVRLRSLYVLKDHRRRVPILGRLNLHGKLVEVARIPNRRFMRFTLVIRHHGFIFDAGMPRDGFLAQLSRLHFERRRRLRSVSVLNGYCSISREPGINHVRNPGVRPGNHHCLVHAHRLHLLNGRGTYRAAARVRKIHVNSRLAGVEGNLSRHLHRLSGHFRLNLEVRRKRRIIAKQFRHAAAERGPTHPARLGVHGAR